MTYPQEPDVDLDDVPRVELGERDEAYGVVDEALSAWWDACDGTSTEWHGVGTFLDELAARGFRVTPIDPGPPLEQLLPPATD
jgi:hypothetical protein